MALFTGQNTQTAPQGRILPPGAAQMFLDTYLTRGKHVEVRQFEEEGRVTIGGLGHGNVGGIIGNFIYGRSVERWDFVEHAVEGNGGFASGQYLQPFRLEVQNGKIHVKLIERIQQADYDQFAHHICWAAWDMIAASFELVTRETDFKPLAQFWTNADRLGTDIRDCLEYPHGQARMFGTSIIMVDRPSGTIANRADDLNPMTAPYIVHIPTRNVVDWRLDPRGGFEALIIEEPDPDAPAGTKPNLRVWTKHEWALFTPQNGARVGDGSKFSYYQVDGAPLNLPGRVIPAVPLWNKRPAPRKLLGRSEMFGVSKIALTVFNMDSEAREVERKAAIVLAMSVKDVEKAKSKGVEIGLDSVLLYDGDAPPSWVSPDFEVLDKLENHREKKIGGAYGMASLRTLVASTETSSAKFNSGYHADVEMQKTERVIATHAGALESTETRVAGHVLRWYGIDPEQVAEKSPFTVKYPRDFGVRDKDKAIERAAKLLGLNLGEPADRKTLEALFKALYSRDRQPDIDAMIEGAVKARALALAQAQQALQAKAGAANGKPSDSVPTSTSDPNISADNHPSTGFAGTTADE